MAIYMLCNIFLFFLNSPSELTFCITLVHYILYYIIVYYITNPVTLLHVHVSATLVAILREV